MPQGADAVVQVEDTELIESSDMVCFETFVCAFYTQNYPI